MDEFSSFLRGRLAPRTVLVTLGSFACIVCDYSRLSSRWTCFLSFSAARPLLVRPNEAETPPFILRSSAVPSNELLLALVPLRIRALAVYLAALAARIPVEDSETAFSKVPRGSVFVACWMMEPEQFRNGLFETGGCVVTTPGLLCLEAFVLLNR